MNLRKFAILLLATFLFTASYAQTQNPLKWDFKVTQQANDNEAVLQFTANLESGWHLYSQHTDPDGPVGISFDFAKSKDYSRVGGVTEPKPTEEYDELFKCTIR